MKVKVAVAGTIGKTIVIDTTAGERALAELVALRAQVAQNSGSSSTILHSALQGLQTGNDHPQYPLRAGNETIPGPWTFLGNFNIGDPGTESGSVQLDGATYTAKAKINEFAGTNDAALILHRHATGAAVAANMLMSRSRGTTAVHMDVNDGDVLGRFIFAGWNTNSYWRAAEIDAVVSGTPGVNDMPGALVFKISADGSNTPTERFRIDSTRNTWTLPHGGPAGTAAAPTWSFSGDTNTGMYSIGADNLGWSTNGTLRMDLSTTRLLVNLPIQATNATTGIEVASTAPRILLNDTNAGANAKLTEIVGSNGGIDILSRTDADAAGQVGIRLSRGAGTAWSRLQFGETGSPFTSGVTFNTVAADFSDAAGVYLSFNQAFGLQMNRALGVTLFDATDTFSSFVVDAGAGNLLIIGADTLSLTGAATLGLDIDAAGNGHFGSGFYGSTDGLALYFGASDDLSIVHDGTNSVIRNNTGVLLFQHGATEVFRTAAARLTMNVPLRLKGYTVATLPAGAQGDTAFVTDALAPAFLAAVVGGGAIVTSVFYNGAAWTVG